MLYQFFIDANSEDNNGSSRGLLSLFAIGFVPLFLGITVESFKLDIPWLTTISVESPEKVAIIYCIIVVFSVFRFAKRNEKSFQDITERCLSNFIFSRLARFHFARIINIDVARIANVAIQKESENNEFVVRIHSKYTLDHKFAIYYQVVGTSIVYKSYEIPLSVPSHQITVKNCKENFSSLVDSIEFDRMQANPIQFLPNYINRFIHLRSMLNISLSDLSIFDILIPIFINLIFVNYYIWSYVLRFK